MCGITGIINLNNEKIDPIVLKRMANSLKHRGPDDTGFFIKNNIGLANTRLSILDIEGGNQPFLSDDKNVVVIQNGEIYNYLEIADELKNSKYECNTSSDTEIILKLYEKYADLGKGPEAFLEKLNGMFSISIHDSRINKTWIIRDRLGIKPLFIAKHNKTILFASEIKSILQSNFKREINFQSLDKLLTFNFVPPPSTLFKGIDHLPPGTIGVIENNSFFIKKWWSIEENISQTKNKSKINFLDEKVNNLNYLLNDSVRIRMRSDAPFGAFLSGGIDSSTIVGMMDKYKKEQIKTYSIGFQEKEFDETSFALEASKRFNTKHKFKILDHKILNQWEKTTYYCDQPHGDISFIPTYEVSKLASKEVKMVLTGDGGDELFAGYDKYKNFFNGDYSINSPIHNLSDIEFRKLYSNEITVFSLKEREELLKDSHKNKKSKYIDYSLFTPYQYLKKTFYEVEHLDRLNQVLAIDCKMLLPGNNLVKPDRMGMAASIEARTPFLDYRFVKEAFSIPGDLKLKNNSTKFILKKLVNPLIGENLTNRKKQMFTVPIGEWIKNEFIDEIKSWLFDKRTIERKLFNKEYVEELLNQHITGKVNRTRQLRLLVAIEIWLRIYIDPSNFANSNFNNYKK